MLGDRPAGELLRAAVSPRSSTFHRVGAIARYLAGRSPFGVRIRGSWEIFDGLPIRGTWGRLLGIGSVASCVAVDSAPPRYVVKFWRRSLATGMPELIALARMLQDEYETVLRWYGDIIPDLLPRTVHVVLKAPMHGVPAAAAIQELVEGRVSDLLGDYSDPDLVLLLLRHDRLRADFIGFTERTRRAWDVERLFLDIVGPNNVMLVEVGCEPRMRVTDFGIWDLEQQRREAPRRYARAERALERLERVTDRVR